MASFFSRQTLDTISALTVHWINLSTSKAWLAQTLGLFVFLIPSHGWAQNNPGQAYAKFEASVYTMGAEIDAEVFAEGRSPHYGPDWDEGPRHEVEISSFQISKQQVSQFEFAKYDPGYRTRLTADGTPWSDDSPAVMVNWNEANAYCDWLANSTGQPYRLPTEAEWELAASQRAQHQVAEIGDGIQEWCRDYWALYPKTNQRAKDPTGPKNGAVRVIRDGGGGSVEEKKEADEPVADYRLTDRSASVAQDKRPTLGFRVVIGKTPPLDSRSSDATAAKVAQPKITWNPIDQQAPYFWAGGEFMQLAGANRPPYWNRHHVPSITWCDNGDLLATAFTAAFDNSDQMAILSARLPYGQKKWTPAKLFFIAPDHNVTSAALFNAGEGELYHFNGIGTNHSKSFSMVKRISRDNGASWSQPTIVHRFPTTGAASAENPFGKPRLWPHMDIKSFLINGRKTLLMSTDVGPGNDFGSAIFSSVDNGDSWQELTRTGWQAENFAKENKTAGWIAGIHAPVEQTTDGSLIAIGRSSNINGFSPMSLSTDLGKSWSYSASPFPPILSGQRSVLLRLTEGPLLFISFTDSSMSWGQKTVKGMDFQDSAGKTRNGIGIFAALSFDDGKTWPMKKLIPNDVKQPWKSRYNGYFSCIQTPDQLIHLVSSEYYYRFNLAWLKQSTTAP